MRRTSFGVLFLALLAGRPCSAEEAVSPWRDEALVGRRLAEAIAAVEEACGAKFETKPTVALSKADDLLPILEREVGKQMSATGENVEVRSSLRLLAAMLLAKYEPGTRVIHLVPDTVDNIAKALEMPLLTREGVLRVILAHEATHALDFERFPLDEARAHLATNEEMLAYGAVVEGHAQLVSERVAARWGVTADWEAYTRAITAVPPGLDVAQRMFAEATAAQVGFGYVKGHAFLRAVEAARGREGVEAALRTPPKTTREVERPELWLDPTKRGAALDMKALFAALREAVESPAAKEGVSDAPAGEKAGGPWTVQITPALASAVETQFAYLPKEEREGVTDALEEGQVFLMSRGEQRVAAFVGRFTTPEAAALFRDVDVRVARRKDEIMKEGSVRILSATYADGIGKDHARPGTRIEKEVASGFQKQRVRIVIGTIGRYVLEVSTVDVDDLADERLQSAIEEACRAIEALEAPR